MLKLLLKLFFILLILSFGYVYNLLKEREEKVSPLPYKFKTNIKYDNLQRAQESQVLFIGGELSQQLEKYFSEISTRVSSKLKTPINIYNWKSDREGLHRIIHKIKSLKKIPPLVFVIPGEFEHVENRFKTSELKKIFYNYKTYSSDELLTLIMAVPYTSRFLYLPIEEILFTEKINEHTQISDEKTRLKSYLVLQKTLQMELNELASFSKEKEFKLSIILPPLNLELPPEKDCDEEETRRILDLIAKVENLISSENYKMAYSELDKISHEEPQNASYWFNFGKAAVKIGKFQKGKQYLEMASRYDCLINRKNIRINEIIYKESVKNGLSIIDFNNLLNKNIGRDHLFLHDNQPQEIYYKELIYQIENIIKSTLNL